MEKNLRYLSQCRSIKDVYENKNLTENCKVFILKSAFGTDYNNIKEVYDIDEDEMRDIIDGKIFLRNLLFIKRRGKNNFILGDSFPLYYNSLLNGKDNNTYDANLL